VNVRIIPQPLCVFPISSSSHSTLYHGNTETGVNLASAKVRKQGETRTMAYHPCWNHQQGHAIFNSLQTLAVTLYRPGIWNPKQGEVFPYYSIWYQWCNSGSHSANAGSTPPSMAGKQHTHSHNSDLACTFVRTITLDTCRRYPGPYTYPHSGNSSFSEICWSVHFT
jgi:hypothetical protein